MGKVFTKQISNSTFTLSGDEGVTQLSVKNTSASALNITITGTQSIGGLASAPITLSQGDAISLTSNTPFSGVTVTSADASALAEIVASA